LSTIFLNKLWHLQRMKALGTAITPAQCRAARALLGWSQKELAEKAGISAVAVNQFETGISEPRRSTLEVVRRAFERAGVVFIDENGGGAGLRLKRRSKK
jgi:transcriptional regulator with XRE-family HTH domain